MILNLQKKFTKHSGVCFIVWCYSSMVCQAQAVIYPGPGTLKPSAEYSVKVDGRDAFVYASPVPAAYCSFDMSGPVEVIIKANRDIKWVDVRPLSAGVKPIFKDSTITLSLSKPVQLSIELNGSIRMPLFVFANAPEKNKPSKGDPNVRFFEAGKIHYAGMINVKSNETIYIEGGAVVVGVIKAHHVNHIRVAGHGILDGTYNNKFSDSIIRTKDAEEIAANISMGKYERFLEFIDCDDVVVDGVTLHNSTAWQVVPIHSNNVRISNIKIVSDQASDDGIDIVRSTKVRIENSFIRTKDDCIAIKAHLNYPKSESVDDVLVQNCTFWNALWGNGIEIGFELNAAEIKNIVFRNNDIIHIEAGAAISIHNAGSGHVKNVVFDNIRIEDARQKLFDFAIFRSQYSEDGTHDEEERRRFYLNGAWDGVLSVPAAQKSYHAQFRGRISDVLLKDIKIIDGLFPYSVFYGYDAQHNVNGITIQNLTVHGKKITSLAGAKLSLENTSNVLVK